jgi:hypothetical protein
VADKNTKKEERTILSGCVHAEASVLYRSPAQLRGRGPVNIGEVTVVGWRAARHVGQCG